MSPLQMVERFAYDPADTSETRVEKSAIAVVASLCSMAGVVWTLMYLAVFGVGLTAALPAVFVVVVGGSLVVSHRTRNHWFAVYAQIICIMYLTAFIQWSIGGIFASGFVMAWAFCGPITALVFFSVRRSLIWFALYFINIVITVVFDGWFARHGVPVSQTTRAAFFVMNLSISSLVVFAFAGYFVQGRQKATEALAQSHRELLVSQHALIHSEKLAALGQLVAGVAHELNTPLGAIRASIGNLGGACNVAIHEIPETLAVATADERGAFRRLVSARGADAPVTSREERQRRRAVRQELETRGQDSAREVAEALVEVGVTSGLDGYSDLLTSPRVRDLVRSARTFGTIKRAARTIELAAERASKIVFALKSYAHPGSADGQSAEAPLAENLDTVLTLYHNQLKHGVEVTREYQEPGAVFGHHDALNQVWTNLIHNALQAMKNHGHLILRVSGDTERVQVQVEDDGPGIKPEVLPRVFEPFFTTKEQGEGSGLGLSISKQIIEEHSGTLAVESRPGRTVFTVGLPRRVPDMEAGT